MVAGEDEHGDTSCSDFSEGAECSVHECFRRPGRVENVASHHKKVGVGVEDVVQDATEVGLEIIPPASAFDSGSGWLVEPQVGISSEDHTHVRHVARSRQRSRLGCKQRISNRVVSLLVNLESSLRLATARARCPLRHNQRAQQRAIGDRRPACEVHTCRCEVTLRLERSGRVP